jgi:hypothetical protein
VPIGMVLLVVAWRIRAVLGARCQSRHGKQSACFRQGSCVSSLVFSASILRLPRNLWVMLPPCHSEILPRPKEVPRRCRLVVPWVAGGGMRGRTVSRQCR